MILFVYNINLSLCEKALANIIRNEELATTEMFNVGSVSLR
jgi:hypothetical protein